MSLLDNNSPFRGPRTRNTIQRRAVLEAIHVLDGRHPTAAEIFEQVRLACPRLSLATVYRSLDALLTQGAITEVRAENVTRYDGTTTPHHHIICARCGAVRDVCAEVLSVGVMRHLEECSGFRVELRPVQFYGLCPDCQPLNSAGDSTSDATTEGRAQPLPLFPAALRAAAAPRP